MKSTIYHLGLSPPPLQFINNLNVCHYPLLKVKYKNQHKPEEILDILKIYPIILIVSKNAVIGIEIWLSCFNLNSDIFANTIFWTVGNRTHKYLKDNVGLYSFFPKEMTGECVINELSKQKIDKVLLVSSKDSKSMFIKNLIINHIGYFHFPVYQISQRENIEFLLKFEDVDSNYLVITSPSTVQAMLRILSIANLADIKCKIISIGPTTSKTIKKNGGIVFFESDVQNFNTIYKYIPDMLTNSSN